MRDIESADGRLAGELVQRGNHIMWRAAPYLQLATRPTDLGEEPRTADGSLMVRAESVISRVRAAVSKAYRVHLCQRESERIGASGPER